MSKRVENQLKKVAEELLEKRKKTGLQKNNTFDLLLMNRDRQNDNSEG